MIEVYELGNPTVMPRSTSWAVESDHKVTIIHNHMMIHIMDNRLLSQDIVMVMSVVIHLFILSTL